MSSINLRSFGDIDLVPSQESLIYKKAKMAVDLKDKKLIHEGKKEHKKQTYNSLFDF
ncbi:TPA: hypothetical protein N2D60_003663 [Clostridium botulinum]|nr:hypothetical protein [Clostridium botulinum]